ncbi:MULTISPECIES: HupE/UreJ family protein [unclassified Prochlorococcus]|uniref:HupE/UreJ family protein n=1 Tax=unclassified Prochlorococcus TaxID=2627481 RepID=UPI000533A070|nr:MULTISPECIES: HupE/UreJ family protein [unclassified Prochlorococcus]KGG25501.1 HupE-UreJ family cobalt transporter [Prochlorococcus sp. MIT 0701]KGG30299.1 HupE-UreJ family cobalt transporter [Prochlorococcus sp. MIT 0702]KGG35718.1 HupE-UreJ family cobalt transporter [Prochlorococcus sp. MIT 0703]
MAAILATPALLAMLVSPAFAHHPFGMGEGQNLNAMQGLVSGIGHPLLGPDHLLFLLAIGFVGLNKPRKWLVPLLAAGLLGSAISLVIPLPETLSVYAEALVSLSLAIAGLVALGTVSPLILVPVISLHGYLLGGAIVGAESTPLAAYFLGLLISQGTLLLIITSYSRRIIDAIGNNGVKTAAGIWIGIGAAFTWSLLIP